MEKKKNKNEIEIKFNQKYYEIREDKLIQK